MQTHFMYVGVGVTALTALFVSLVVMNVSVVSPSVSVVTDAPIIDDTLEEFPARIPIDLTTGKHLGLNFFIFNDTHDADRALTPETTTTSVSTLGAESVRQLTNGDALWNVVEPKKGEWDWTTTDAALRELATTTEPIVTLFSLQYASPNAPWSLAGTFEKTITDDAETYLRTVVSRYKDIVRYWEIGNEMDHWRAADSLESITSAKAIGSDKLPTLLPADGYSPAEQGAFFAKAAAIIREEDPDAVIVMPGISALSDYQLKTWLPGVISTAGVDAFDVVNYHEYTSWTKFAENHTNLDRTLATLGLDRKPIWLTETGSTTESSLTTRTNYPNSPTSQAADVLRRTLLALSEGDSLVLWHTYFSSPNENNNAWRGYGLLDELGDKNVSYDVYKTLGSYFPVTSVEVLVGTPAVTSIQITSRAGNVAYAVWGTGSYTAPETATSQCVITDSSFPCSAISSGTNVVLTDIPVLFR